MGGYKNLGHRKKLNKIHIGNAEYSIAKK